MHAVYALFACSALAACSSTEPLEREARAHAAAEVELTVEPRAAFLPTYPCSSCHQSREPNPRRRWLTDFHTRRNTEFNHGNSERWCYQCHSIKNIDRLVISSGDLVSFDEAYKVCGGCHGDKLRDWKLAVHGKSMGGWKGHRIRRSCPGCHNPHNPHFPPLSPEAPPLSPQALRPPEPGQ